MKEFRTNNKQEESLAKVILNDKEEYVLINGKDATIFDRFAEFIKWLDDMGNEIKKKEKDIEAEYGKDIVQRDEDGAVEDINTGAFIALSKLRTDTYREAAERIETVFGTGTMRKYFNAFYELNPEFVPDDECIYDFIEEITPVLNEIFADRKKRIELKYNRNRRGGKGNRYRNKEELIRDYGKQ